jgi:intracellular sulfur oxidation DsrE/DsrF family protein
LKGEEAAVEIVTFGPGLNMLRDDTSPVKGRIAAMALEMPGVTFIACANTHANMSKQENKPVALVSEAKLMPSGSCGSWSSRQGGSPTYGPDADGARGFSWP